MRLLYREKRTGEGGRGERRMQEGDDGRAEKRV